jgi:hypothetical protein
MLIVQWLPGATAAPQLFVWAKSPVTEMPETFNEAVPELVRVTGWLALVVPGACMPKIRLEGEKVAMGALTAPVPESATA